MRKILLPLAIAAGLVTTSAFAFDLGSSVDQANAKAQAGLDATAKAQTNADAKVDATTAGVNDKAAAVDSATGMHTSDKVKSASTKVKTHKAKGDVAATGAHKKAADTKDSLNAAAANAGIGGTAGK